MADSLTDKIKDWFLNRKRRKGLREFQKHLRHILHVNDDILPNSKKEELNEILQEAGDLKADDVEGVDHFLDRGPLRVAKVLPKKSWPTVREYADILAVAFMVAFGIRGLFFQPFKIPTSSMQPTLFGIHYAEKEVLPDWGQAANLPLFGAERAYAEVQSGGMLDMEQERQFTRALFWPQLRFVIGSESFTLPGTRQKVYSYAKLSSTYEYKKGDVVADGWLVSGDHLFVDRYSHHFTGLDRGDVIVFNTEGLSDEHGPLMERGYYYIKRLVGLPGDKIKIVDKVVQVCPKGESEFKPITEYAPEFKKIYSFKGGYHGHQDSGRGMLPRYLGSDNEVYTVPKDHYFAMGDNSLNSLDSRYWGSVPRRNIVGRALLVFWPFSRRWGITDTKEPLDVDTRMEYNEIMTMRLQ